MAPDHLLLPMKLDAFVFNGKVCSGDSNQAKIAPITQPNYTFLRLNEHLAQNDILDHIDLYNSTPASRNPRYTDIGKATTRQTRVGVYVHWSLPKPIRSGVAATKTAEPVKQAGTNDRSDYSAPQYPIIPNRWLVVRSLDPKTTNPIPKNPPIEALTAWVIESDKTFSIDDLPESVDLEVDVAPFITSFLEKDQSVDEISIDRQAEIFIGKCTPAVDWEKEELPQDERRVALGAGSSSNPMFLDFQYHCSNVFSMLDTFSYKDGNNVRYLESADASYYVIGWNSKSSDDILSLSDVLLRRRVDSKAKPTRGERLSSMRIKLDEVTPASDKDVIQKWTQDQTSARTLFHGAMYDVVWNVKDAPRVNPADKFSTRLQKNMPLAVGTTPIDAMLSYIKKNQESDSLEQSIWQLRTFLRSEDDSIDAQMAAADEVQSSNYAHHDGGTHYYLPAERGKNAGARPSDDDQRKNRYRNSAQHLLDASQRQIDHLRWELFAWWWKFISDIDNVNGSRNQMYTEKANEPKDAINDLQNSIDYLRKYVGEVQAPIKNGAMEEFHQRTDPTLLLAGLESGWPKDFTDSLKARLDNQILEKDKTELPGAQARCLPKELRGTAQLLLQEFLQLVNAKDPEARKPTDRVLPLYHDGKIPSEKVSSTNQWRDRWNCSQAWFPLYLEWEAEYAHISYEYWSLQQLHLGEKDDLAPKITYTITKDIEWEDPDNMAHDTRTVSGRSLILPQPSFSLKICIEHLFNTVPKETLDKALDSDKRSKLLANLDKMQFLSISLSGLSDHLATMYQGSHVKPLVRKPGENPTVLQDVVRSAKDIHIYEEDLKLIDKESDPTPYGSLPTLVGQTICGFKPVTHGQLRFTKINVIDKFGQVVHAVDPMADRPPPVYPSMSEVYSTDPKMKDPKKPNVVDPRRSQVGHSEFIQLPPAINQPARINAHFVVHDEDPTSEHYWRPATEFDEPIWGWIVVNYVDRGLQFFQPNGDFYREARITEGTTGEVVWLPFKPPSVSRKQGQLDYLLENFMGTEGQKYLSAFMDMIMTALGATVVTPSSYSQFLNALIGRPLALANMGWSMELSMQSRKNQSTVNEQIDAKLEHGLLPEDNALKRYEFAIKFGDKARNYDGLVGYFKARETKNLPTPKRPDDDLLLNQIYTYYHDAKPLDGSPLKDITHNDYTKFKTFWIDPRKHIPKNKKNSEVEEKALRYERLRNRELKVFGALFDPFAPITGFSSILPIRKLTLSSWTWEIAFKRITAFFHAGPLLLSGNVPAYSETKRVKQDEEKYPVERTLDDVHISIPALKAADWAWLQPYDLDSKDDPLGYMSIDVLGDTDEKPEWQKGPMTATEGYLQLKAPIEQGKPPEALEA